MASRSISFRNQNVSRNENVAVKKVAKLVSGPTVKRAALGDIANKAAVVQRSATDASKLKQNDTFKKPLQPRNKNIKNENVPSKIVPSAKLEAVDECSMVSVDTSCSVPQDMSVVEHEPVKESSSKDTSNVQPLSDNCVQDLSEAFSAKCLTVTDIDADDKDNPQLVSEYVNEIYAYMRSLEIKNCVRRRYLDGHTVTPRMRTILVDWLVQVHMRFNLMQETLYLTMAILDRYLQLMPDTPKEELQLVGVTSMFIASKYEEMYCSEINDFVFISDKAYTRQQIRKMEIQILKKLDYNVSMPLPLHFLRRNSKAAKVDGTQHTLAKYLIELCLTEYNMCHFKASQLGAAALFLTLKLTCDDQWSDTLTYYSGYSDAELMPVVCKMAQVVLRSYKASHQATVQKYRSSKNLKISECPELTGPVIRSLAVKAATYS
ncbi:G2/mitotic-specific cyclin-B [Hyalella azteca]|uniref:G2/mitotic-specific cyclin-B n=1 Tax=Hyalella azteca TaxID=294128 RepID=A0A8B7N8L0_HYAAZ|nr:G2/mitotic-specific cyclin-B [Hyalella azteca]